MPGVGHPPRLHRLSPTRGAGTQPWSGRGGGVSLKKGKLTSAPDSSHLPFHSRFTVRSYTANFLLPFRNVWYAYKHGTYNDLQRVTVHHSTNMAKQPLVHEFARLHCRILIKEMVTEVDTDSTKICMTCRHTRPSATARGCMPTPALVRATLGHLCVQRATCKRHTATYHLYPSHGMQ